MVKSKMKELIKMIFLDESLKNIASMDGMEVEEKRSFSVDAKYSRLFEVLSGSCMIATTWREMPESDEVTGLFTLKGRGCAISSRRAVSCQAWSGQPGK